MMQATYVERQGMQRFALPERVLTEMVHFEMKRAVLQYTEAAIEAEAAEVRRLFERLAQESVRMLEQLEAILRQNQWQAAPVLAAERDVQRTSQQIREMQRAMQLFVQAQLQPVPPMTSQYGNGMLRPQPGDVPLPPEYALPRAVPGFQAVLAASQTQVYGQPLAAAPPVSTTTEQMAKRMVEPTSEPASGPHSQNVLLEERNEGEPPVTTSTPAQAKRGRKAKSRDEAETPKES